MEPAQQQLQTFGSQPDVGQPYLKPRWFHAVDVPKADTTPFKVATAKETPKAPAVWKSFTAQNSAALETAYQRLSDLRLKEREKEKAGNKSTVEKDPRGFKVHVNEDNLFEADVEKKEYYPIYWHGPTYDIRRGTWFFQSTGNVFFPCDENLARQIEDGYRKFQPWKESTPAAITPSAIAASPPKPASAAPTDHGDILKPVDGRAEARWPLLGPYIGQYVIFAGAHNAWQFSDQLASKLTRAVMNMGGTRLVRGWDEVSRLNRKASRGHLAKDKTQDLANQAKGKETTEKAREGQEETSRGIEGVSPANGGRMTSEQAQKLQQKMESEDYDASQEDPDRKIDHLMLVIHGIGQKLGERMEAVNFVHDCNVLRRTFKDTAKQYASVKEQLRGPRKAAAVDIPDHGGVQLLPVQWRHRVNFGAIRESNKEDKNGAPKIEQTTLEDITLDGVPSIRMLVSDVILDVLLYMTPRYRQEMVNYVTEELNRIYRLFKKHNPNFEGKVSLYGHSLGSLLAFDILCHQPKRRDKVQVTGLEQQPGKKKPAEVDLSDLMHGASSAEERRGKRFLDRPDIKYQVLEFEVDRLFVVGSPVGLFMLLKGDKMRARLLEMAKEEGEMVVDEDGLLRPEVNAIYNIFHPHDPVAYRIEPIIKKEHAELKPVQIPYTKGGLKGTVLGITDLGNDLVDRSRWVFESVWARTADVVSSAGKVASIVSAFRAPVATAAAGAENKPATDSEAPPVTTEDSIPGTSQKLSNDKELTRLNPRGRIDYALQEGVLENPYLSALGVHMAYWPDQDCAMFILSELYRQSKEEASEDAQTPGSGTASGKGGSLDMPGGKGKAEEKAGGNLARTPSLNKPALPPRTKPAASPADATPLSSTPPRSGFASLLSGLGLGTATTAPTPEIVPAGAVAIPKTKTVPGETELQDLGSLARSPGDLSKSTSEIMSELDHLSYL